MEPAETFDYANRTGRPTGRLVTVAGRVIPGIAAVQRQVAPYAESWRRANLAAIISPGPRWIVLGDSMSQGIGAGAFDRGWVDLVGNALRDAGRPHRIVNLSASGARTEDLLTQQVPAWRDLPPTREPDLVTVLVGSNDLMSRAHRDTMPTAFAELLAELPERAVVATLPQPRAAAAAVNALIALAVEQRGLIAVDMRSDGPRSWRGKLAEDHFHPNEAGYRGIADAFTPAVLDATSRP